MTGTHRMSATDRALRSHARRGGRVALITAWVALLVLWTAPSASAHSTLVSSNPAEDSVVATPPTTITLTFSQHVLPDNDQVAVTVGSAAPVVVNPTIDGPNVTADLSQASLPAFDPKAGAVTWKIGFRVVSADGHPVTGVYSFTVGTGAAAVAAPAASAGGGGWMWPVIGGVVVLLAVVAFVLFRLRRNTAGGRAAASPGVSGA